MKYKTCERYCVKIVIGCAECSGNSSRFHQPIDTYDSNLCIWVVLHIISQEAVTDWNISSPSYVQHIRERERERKNKKQLGFCSFTWNYEFEVFFNRLWSSGCEFNRYKYFNRSYAPIFRVRKNKLKIHLFMMLHWCGWGSFSSVVWLHIAG